MIQASGLRHRYGDRVALDGVDLEVRPGEIVGLLGGNGAGKTTTFRLLAGILEPQEGRVEISGQRLTRRSTALRGQIGLVPQAVALYPTFTARENLRVFGRAAGVGRRELARRIDELLAAVDLASRADEPVHQLSGGMARRLNLVCGLLHRPSVLLLDEPVVGVDPQSRRAIFTLVSATAEAGAAVLYTSHQLDEAERLCDRFVVLDQGRIAASGALDELGGPRHAGLRVRLRPDAELRAACAVLTAAPWAGPVHLRSDGLLDVEVDDPASRLTDVAELLAGQVEGIEVPRTSLEHLVLELTGSAT